MEDDLYLNPLTRITIERVKADGLRTLRPFLQPSQTTGWFGRKRATLSKESEEAIQAYLLRVVKAHIHCLVESQLLPPNLDVEAFANRAIEDATKYANDPNVERNATVHRVALTDYCGVAYLMDLERRMTEWSRCPTYNVLHYDPEEEEKIAAEWAALKVQREAESKALSEAALEAAAEPTEDTQPASDPGRNGADRRAAVDAYIEEVFSRTGKRITRTDIWKSARYKSRTEFERWERDDPDHPNMTANHRFTRILTEKPHLN